MKNSKQLILKQGNTVITDFQYFIYGGKEKALEHAKNLAKTLDPRFGKITIKESK